MLPASTGTLTTSLPKSSAYRKSAAYKPAGPIMGEITAKVDSNGQVQIQIQGRTVLSALSVEAVLLCLILQKLDATGANYE